MKTYMKFLMTLLFGALLNSVDAQVVLYQHDNYKGTSQYLKTGKYTAADLKKVGNDKVSSIKLAKDMKITIYEHDHFRGKRIVLTRSNKRLSTRGFNDSMSSAIVEALPNRGKKTVKKTKKTKRVKVTFTELYCMNSRDERKNDRVLELYGEVRPYLTAQRNRKKGTLAFSRHLNKAVSTVERSHVVMKGGASYFDLTERYLEDPNLTFIDLEVKLYDDDGIQKINYKAKDTFYKMNRVSLQKVLENGKQRFNFVVSEIDGGYAKFKVAGIIELL